MTKSVILTPAHIERLKCGALTDREVPGLSIIVAGSAKKQWRFKRVVAGTKKTVELILGVYPAFSIDEAREWAGPLSKAVARGEDPRETRRAEEAMAMSVADAHAIYMDAMRRGDRKKLKPRTILDKDKMYIWTLPPERSKNGEENVVALGPWGRRLAQTNYEWLFPSPRIDGPQRAGWFKARDRIHARMEAFAGRIVSRWHFHDLRRTFRSHARRVGIDNEIAELMLNHKRKGIEGIYNRNQELELRAEGFAAWERHLVGLAHSAGVAESLLAPPREPDPG